LFNFVQNLKSYTFKFNPFHQLDISKGRFRGVLGVLKHPLQVYSTPVQSFARHWQSRSSVSLDNLCVCNGDGSLSSCKKVRWWSIMRVAVGWDLFFYFALHLEKLEVSQKICEVMLSHTYVSATKGISSAATV